MRALVQRVTSAHVEIAGEVVGGIDRGLLAYLGFGHGDAPEDRAWVMGKIVGARVFDDDAGRMAWSMEDVGGSLLLVSQFTLYGDLRRGRRPDFKAAMAPELAEAAYQAAILDARALGARVETGRFRADMKVYSVNDGPVTLWLDSAQRPESRGAHAEDP